VSALAETPEDILGGGFLTVSEAARLLGLSRAKLYSIMDQGKLRYAKFDKARRIPRKAVSEYVAACMVGS
jgi:excisionase family DNA binding protein